VTNHIQPLSKEKIALAENGGNGAGDSILGLLELLNPIVYLNFLVAILAAVNDFLVRKAGTQ
jgi:hypothetical protein